MHAGHFHFMEYIEEVWKPITGYPNYEISNCGRVRSLERKIRYLHSVTREEHFRLYESKLLKQQLTKFGYYFVQPYNDNGSKNKTIHRLVAIEFVENPHNFNVVNHIDGNKKNNRFDNLEWCTDAYNHEHAQREGLLAKGSRVASAKLNERCVIAIKKLLLEGWTHDKVSALFEVSRTTITLIENGATWKHISTKTELTHDTDTIQQAR